MIKGTIGCDWLGCTAFGIEDVEGAGYPGWGHIRGFRLDSVQRDLHLCPKHLSLVGEFLKGAKNELD
jgi:hypothetical protein